MKTARFVTSTVLVGAAIELVAACSVARGGASAAGPPREDRELASATIGPEGGRIEAAALVLEIPAGALATTTTVTVSEIVDPASSAGPLPASARVRAGGGFAIGPTSLRFTTPAKVHIRPGAEAVPSRSVAAILFRSAPRSREWHAAGASALESDPLAAWVDGAADVLATTASSGCFSHKACGGDARAYSCTVTNGTAGVRCARDPSGEVRCSCTEAPFHVVATLAQMPTTNAFYGALAMLCGATCPEPAGCMPKVSCHEDFGVSQPPDTDVRWGCDVSPASYESFGANEAPSSPPRQALLCLVGDNRPPVPGGPKVHCVCSESGPFEPAAPLSIATMPSVEEVLGLWRDHCAPGCP